MMLLLYLDFVKLLSYPSPPGADGEDGNLSTAG